MLISEKLYLLMAKTNPDPESRAHILRKEINLAAIADLMMAGRAELGPEPEYKIQLIGAGPCPDPVLAHPLKKLHKRAEVPLAKVADLPELCDITLITNSLAKAGIVEVGPRRMFGLGKRTVRLLNDQVTRQLRSDIAAAIRGHRILSTSDAAVLATLYATGMMHSVLADEISATSVHLSRERIAKIVREARPADSAQRSVAAMNSAIISQQEVPMHNAMSKHTGLGN